MIRLIRFFVDNYVLTISAFGALLLFGVVSIFSIGVDLLPPIEIPVVAVNASYPGAGPEEVSNQLAEPIEGALTTLPGISAVTSISMEGFTFVIAQFTADTDVDEAAIDVSQRVNAIVGQLPEQASRPTVQKFDPDEEPILNIALVAPGVDLVTVQAYAEDVLQPQLQRVEGVADVSVIGPAEREIQVLLDPDRLSLYDLTPQAVSGAISASAVNLPAGSVVLQGSRVLLTGRAVPETLAEVSAILIDSSRGLRVSDVATVRDGSAQVSSYSRLNGEPVVLIEVRKVSGSNSVATANAIGETLANLELPSGYRASVVGDTTEFIEHSVNDTLVEMAMAALAVSLIVLMFVGRLGTVFAVVLAIPVSVAGTLVVFSLLDYTFNIVTLLAITVAIGLVVDDAIVVAENIDQYRERGYGLRDAVLLGAGSVSTAVLAATLSLEAVFLPISFLPGIVGQFFSQFGITLAAAIAFSYLEAMFFLTVRLALSPDPLPPQWSEFAATPRRLGGDIRWLGSRLRHPLSWLLALVAAALLWTQLGPPYAALVLLSPVAVLLIRYLGRLLLYLLGAMSRSLFEGGDRMLRWVRARYVSSLDMLLKRSQLVLVVAALMFSSLFVIFPRIGFNFVPEMDTGQLLATLELPSGSSLDRTNRIASEVERVMLADSAVDVAQVSVGTGSLLGESSADTASFTLELVDGGARELSTDQVATELQERAESALAGYPLASFSISNASDATMGGISSGYSIALASRDLNLLQERTEEAVHLLEASPQLRNVESDMAEASLERVFVIEPTRLDGTGLTNSDVYRTLRAYNVGSEAGRLQGGGLDLPIVVRTAPQAVATESAILSLPVYAPALRTTLPLGELGEFETRRAPGSITRLQQEFSAQISADVEPGYSLSTVREDSAALLEEAGVLDERVFEQTEGVLDLLGDLTFYGPIAFGLALLLNYLAIASQFNSFKYPIYLLLTIPLALVGAIWLFFVTGTSLDVISVLGVVMLVGLVTKNAILLLDAALARVAEGDELRAALLHAAEVRFRPIIMTTVTVIVISVPLLLGLGEGSELRYPLGLVILGGVTTSALLTFYVVPAAFWLFERRNYERKQRSADDRNSPTAQGSLPVATE